MEVALHWVCFFMVYYKDLVTRMHALETQQLGSMLSMGMVTGQDPANIVHYFQ